MSKILIPLIASAIEYKKAPILANRFVFFNALSKARNKLNLDWSGTGFPVNANALSLKEFDEVVDLILASDFGQIVGYCHTAIQAGKDRADDVDELREAAQNLHASTSAIVLKNYGQWILDFEYLLRDYERLPVMA